MRILRKLSQVKRRPYDEQLQHEISEKDFDISLLDIAFEELWLTSDLGYRLYGRYYKASGSAKTCIIAVHGYTSFGISMLPYMKEFTALGYDVFIPDNRYFGQSGGTFCSFGYFERYDIVKWIDLLSERDPEMSFGIFGVSMGAAISMMVAAMDNRIKFLIEYCGYANMHGLLLPYMKNSEFLYKICAPSLFLASRILYGSKLDKIRPDLDIKSLTIPGMLLHSLEDTVVDYKNAVMLHTQRPDFTLVTFEHGRHARSISVNHDQFMSAVTLFLLNNDKANIS
jgi:pimeloyl-ACP methyl ester carboxylesterase